MDIAALATELAAGHPVTDAYSADAATAAGELNAVNCERNRTSMTGSEVANAVDATDWGGLTEAAKQDFWNIVHLGTINPFGVEATLLVGIFGAGSDTIVALAAARVEAISRATKLGFPTIREGHVLEARAI